MNKLSAVFWDVDGTIADTELSGHRVAFNLAFRDFDLDWNWDEEKYLELLKISGGLNRIIYFRDKLGSKITNQICKKIQARKRFHYKELILAGKISVRNGVLRLINQLAEFNVEQIIVTTSGKGSLQPFLNTSLYSHLKFFSHVITYEDVKNHKPFPDAYNLAKELTRKPNTSCVAIEDSSIGIEAAITANINCLLTLPPWHKQHQSISKNATACVDKLGEYNEHSKLIYGKQLINNIIDFEYLTYMIN